MTPDQQFEAVIKPIILRCRERRGFATLLIRQLALLGHPVKRQAFSRWVHRDPEKRIQPSLGAGLMLLQAATMAEREWERTHAENSCRSVRIKENRLPGPSGA